MTDSHTSEQFGDAGLALAGTAIQRVRSKMRGHRQMLFWFSIFTVVWIFGAFLLSLIFHQVGWPMWVGFLITIGWLAIYSKFVIPLRVMVTCPNCDEQINLNKDWICGSCDEEKSPFAMQTFVQHSVPLEHCDSCDAIATEIECPCCSAKIRAESQGNNEANSKQSLARFL